MFPQFGIPNIVRQPLEMFSFSTACYFVARIDLFKFF
jgi:hypothetical protein